MMALFAAPLAILASNVYGSFVPPSARHQTHGSFAPASSRHQGHGWASLFQTSFQTKSISDIDTDLGVTTVVTAADGSWATSKSDRRTKSIAGAGGRAAAGTYAGAFGFADSCNQLYWLGFRQGSQCRDSAMPELESANCRCQRDGVAWPTKFCTVHMPGRAGLSVTEDSQRSSAGFNMQASSLLMRNATTNQSSPKQLMTSSAASPKQDMTSSSREAEQEQLRQQAERYNLKRMEHEVYGVCDLCCARPPHYWMYMWHLALLFFIPSCCCCFCCRQFVNVSKERARLAEQLDNIMNVQARMTMMLDPRLSQMPQQEASDARFSRMPQQEASDARFSQMPQQEASVSTGPPQAPA